MRLDWNTNITTARWSDSDLRAIRRAVRATLLSTGNVPPRAEISLTLTTNRKIQTINRDWRGKDKATNVLSFPSGELQGLKNWPAQMPMPLGDLVFGYETCAAEAKKFAIKFTDYIAFLAIHGTLHLLGHDHETDTQHRRMMRAEIAVLTQLGLANPYPLMHNSRDNA